MTMNSDHAERHRRKKYIAASLFVSVLLNLFLVVVFACSFYGHREERRFTPLSLGRQHGEMMEERLTRYLNPADAAAFHEAMQPQVDMLKTAHDHVHDAMKEVADAYEEEPADPAALQAALDRVKQAKGEVADVVNKIIVDSSAKLSTDGRHRLAEMTR